MRRYVPELGGLGILAVLAHHASGWGLVAMIWWAHRYEAVISPNFDQVGSVPYVFLVIINQLSVFAVPAFLIIAGYFTTYVASNSSNSISWRFLKTRIGNLIWPYLIWSLLIFLIDAALGIVYSPGEYLVKLLTGQATAAYFFVPLLIQMYLLSPLLLKWTRTRPNQVLLLSALIQIVLVLLPYIGFMLTESTEVQASLARLDWLFFRWLFFFILGIYMGARSREVTEVISRYWLWLGLLTLGFAIASIFESELLYRITQDRAWAQTPLKLSSLFYATFAVMMFFGWRTTIRKSSHLLVKIGGMSYGIYLIHPKLMEFSARSIYHLLPVLLRYQVLFSFILFAIGSVGSIFILSLFARSPARRIYRYVFG